MPAKLPRPASAGSPCRWWCPSRATSTPWSARPSTAGATALKPASKSLWGYGGVVQAPDGTIWKIATSGKKDTGPVTRDFDELVLLLGVEDVKASKQFYVGQGLTVGKSFGGKYVEFVTGPGPVKLALYKRRALAKDAGVPADGTGSHRLVLSGSRQPVQRPGRVRLGGHRTPDRHGLSREASPLTGTAHRGRAGGCGMVSRRPVGRGTGPAAGAV